MLFNNILNPKNDIAFKKIFGTEKNKDILINFLNDMLVFREQQPITEVSFLKTVQDPEIASKKTSIVDILCRDAVGNAYVVEMQVAKAKGFEKRAQYYAAKAYITQMHKGDENYHNLKEVIFLAIVDFIMFPDKASYKSDHVILDKDTYQNDLKDFSFTFLELAKFTKDKDHLVSMIDKWAYYFKHAATSSAEEFQQIFANDVIISKAYEELNRFHWSDAELSAYEHELKRDMDNKAVLEEQLDQATARGEAIGEARGEARGRTAEKIAIAKVMVQEGVSLELIAKVTQIPLEQLMAWHNS